jgi:hypothetical protein
LGPPSAKPRSWTPTCSFTITVPTRHGRDFIFHSIKLYTQAGPSGCDKSHTRLCISFQTWLRDLCLLGLRVTGASGPYKNLPQNFLIFLL